MTKRHLPIIFSLALVCCATEEDKLLKSDGSRELPYASNVVSTPAIDTSRNGISKNLLKDTTAKLPSLKVKEVKRSSDPKWEWEATTEDGNKMFYNSK